jgi:hypothetical protein
MPGSLLTPNPICTAVGMNPDPRAARLANNRLNHGTDERLATNRRDLTNFGNRHKEPRHADQAKGSPRLLLNWYCEQFLG